MTSELIYGVNPVREALRSSRPVHELIVQTSATDHRLEKLLVLARERSIAIHRRGKEDLSRLCGSTHHQGVALRVEPFGYADLEDLLTPSENLAENRLILILDGIQDPHNLGALIRSAACAGCCGVIIPRDRAVGITPVVEKAAAGAVAWLSVVQVVNIAQTLTALQDTGYWIYGLTAEAPTHLHTATFVGKVGLVIGGEGEGIRPRVQSGCDVLLSIPQYGGVSSLNASVAGGIALFEVARQMFLPTSSP